VSQQGRTWSSKFGFGFPVARKIDIHKLGLINSKYLATKITIVENLKGKLKILSCFKVVPNLDNTIEFLVSKLLVSVIDRPYT
jgi:hypothetical protein